MKKIALIIAGSILLAGCSLLKNMTGSQPDNTVVNQGTPVNQNQNAGNTTAQADVVQVSPQNNSGQSGTATLNWTEEGLLLVELNLTGGNYPGIQPAHIHMGQCPNPGAVKYPLSEVVDGKSVTTVEEIDRATFEAERAQGLAINVHESPDNVQNYTACGNL